MSDRCATGAHTVECELMEMAKLVTIGVVTAREQDNPADAAMLLNDYQRDAVLLGASLATAWSMLFAASTLWVDALVHLHACHHKQTASESIAGLALAYAVGSSSRG